MFELIQKRKRYFLLSFFLISAGIAAMVYSYVQTGTVFPLGVDFKGGTRIEVQFSEPVSENEIREVFNQFDISNPIVTQLQGDNLKNAWQIRSELIAQEDAEPLEEALNEIAPLIPNSTDLQTVSAAVASEVTEAAFVAVVVAAVIILFYIMISFRQVKNPVRYGVCAVAAMIHDLFIIFGFAALTGMFLGWEVDSLFLTAVLTVAGFSLQDTIVVFDRIREK